MYKANDYLVYKKDVCKVKEVKKNKMTGSDYYVLVPINDDSLIIDVPTDNRMGFIRDIVSKQDAEKLIDNIPKIEPLMDNNDKYIEKIYKDLLYSGNHEDLIKIIKTSYLRNEDRANNKKRLSDKDTKFFEQAERYLYNELSISFGMNYEETKEYIIKRVNELMK